MAANSEDDVNVRFGANIDDLKDKLGQVGGLFKNVTERFGALAALLVGGAAFGSFVQEANQVNVEAEKMARTLGITAGEAGVLAVALDDIGAKLGTTVNTDTYTSAFLKFNQALRTNSDELRNLGVDVDAVTSGQKTSNEVFMEALQIVGQHKQGVDQTQVAMKMFGRSVSDVQALVLLNRQALDDARKSAEDLNLTITQEGVEAATRYRVAIDNVGDVLGGMKKTIGEAVMPLLSGLAEQMAELGPTIIQVTQLALRTFVAAWQELHSVVGVVWSAVKDVMLQLRELWSAVFGNDGPDAMQVFTNALSMVQAAFVSLRVGVEIVAAFIRTTLEVLAISFTSLGRMAVAAFNLDWEGVRTAWAEGTESARQALSDGMESMVAIAAKGRTDIDNALLNSSNIKRGAAAGNSGAGGDKKSDVGRDEALLNARNSFIKTVNDGALRLEMEYLRQSEFLLEQDYKNNLISTKEYYQDKLSLEQAGIDALIEAKKREAADAATSKAGAAKEAQRLQFAAQEQKLLFEINELEAKRSGAVTRNAAEYEEAERRRTDALRQIAANRALQSSKSEVEAARGGIEQMRALREIDAQQAFELQRQQEQRSIEALRAFYAEKEALVRGDAEKQAALDAEREAAERAHQDKLLQIDRSASLERARVSIQAQESVQSNFAGLMNDFMSGTVKFQDALRSFAINVATAFQNIIAQRFAEQIFGAGSAGGDLIKKVTTPIFNGIDTIVRKWILGQSTMTAATEASAAARVAAEEGAASESLLVMAATAIKSIAIAAWESAAWVYAAIARIPYVGPFLAPAMAIAAGAAVLGFASNIASAEGGWWQLPGDQIVQAHANEMILPAPEAQGVRDLVSGGGKGMGGMTVNVSAVDAAGVESFFLKNTGPLTAALRKAGRDFKK